MFGDFEVVYRNGTKITINPLSVLAFVLAIILLIGAISRAWAWAF